MISDVREDLKILTQESTMEGYLDLVRDANEEDRGNQRRPYVMRERTDPLVFYNDFEFLDRFRLTKAKVLELLEQIQDQIEEASDRNCALSPSLQLLLALRFLATGTLHRVIGDMVGVARTTAGRKVHKVINAIAGLRNRYIRFPQTHAEMEKAKQEFYKVAAFPGVISVIDGTHVPILCPPGPDAELYRNRKGFMSINVQATCDARHRFTNVVARWPGSTHDSRVWDNCSLRARLERRLEEQQERGIILGDGGYGNSEIILTPLNRTNTAAERRYNCAPRTTRTIIERTFGHAKKKFLCLSQQLRFSPRRCCNTIVAAMVVYNMGLEPGEVGAEDEPGQDMDPDQDDDVPRHADVDNVERRHLIEAHFARR